MSRRLCVFVVDYLPNAGSPPEDARRTHVARISADRRHAEDEARRAFSGLGKGWITGLVLVASYPLDYSPTNATP